VPATLTAVHRFPVKSCRGESVARCEVEPWGLRGDRRWMLVDETGETVTAREHRRLLLVEPSVSEAGLVLTMAGEPTVQVAVPEADDLVPVTVFGGAPFLAALADAEAHTWFTGVLGADVRLVHADEPTRRSASPRLAGPGVPVSFADGYPLNVATESSLAALNELIAEGPFSEQGPLPMVRFRANLVVAGTPAWAEDGWRRIRVGEAVFRVVKGCDRCAIPTTDAVTAERFKEPTATLARHRRWDGGVWFGMNIVPENPGATVSVGDEVEILEAVEATDGPPR
jgi:uncharacterized protein